MRARPAIRCTALAAIALAAAPHLAMAAGDAPVKPQPAPAASTAPPAAAAPGDHGFFVGLDLVGGGLGGAKTRVRENADEGTTFRLPADLGIDFAGEARLRLGWRFDRDDALVFSLTHIFLWGGTRLTGDVHYNGSTLQGGTRLESRPRFLSFELLYERALFRWGADGRGALALDVALRYDLLHWDFQATFAPTSTGHEAAEDFDAQAMPVPLLGVTVRQPIASSLDLVAYGRAMRANHWDSFRTEGGTVYWSETCVEAGLAVAWRLNERVEIDFGYRFLFLDIGEKSKEDGNFLVAQIHGVSAGITLFF
ncbi:MAG: hypothetical protein ACRELB_06115 [Polyangiaceae bacterium]